MRTEIRVRALTRLSGALAVLLSATLVCGAEPVQPAGDPAAQAAANPADTFVGPPAPATAQEVAAGVPQVDNAAERYSAIYALLQFVGMPVEAEKQRERDEFIRAAFVHLQEHARQALAASKLAKCEFNVNRNAFNPALFHIGELDAIDRLLRAACNEKYQAKDFVGAGEYLAARVRVARHLGACPTLVEKQKALLSMSDPLRLIRAWSAVAADADRAAMADELRKIDPNDPFDCRGGLTEMARIVLVMIAKRDPQVGLPWIQQMQPAKAMEFAQFCDSGIKEVIDAWVKPDAQQKIRAVIEGLNNFGQPHPLSGIDRFHQLAMKTRDEVAATIKVLTEPKPAPPDAPAAK
jgi:hypothetical protein